MNTRVRENRLDRVETILTTTQKDLGTDTFGAELGAFEFESATLQSEPGVSGHVESKIVRRECRLPVNRSSSSNSTRKSCSALTTQVRTRSSESATLTSEEPLCLATVPRPSSSTSAASRSETKPSCRSLLATPRQASKSLTVRSTEVSFLSPDACFHTDGVIQCWLRRSKAARASTSP